MKPRHILLLVLALASAAHARAQHPRGSSIVSRTPLSAGGAGMTERRVYDNGLGDVVQETQSFPGSALPDITVRHEYDSYRRRTRSWLPVTTTAGGGITSQGEVAAMAEAQYSDTAPFARTEYDAFLLSMPSAQHKAGTLWQDSGRKVSVTYSEHVGVGMFTDPGEDGYIYVTEGVKYLCTRTVDEDGRPSAEYTDLRGRLMASETAQGITYYVYNERGDLSHVIPPALAEYITANYEPDTENVPDTDGMMMRYAYIYRYDNRRNCVYRKLPGCEPVYHVYDRTGALILTQDGVQRQRGEWAYSIPDRFGRPCVSGVCGNTVSYADEPLRRVCVYAEYDGVSAGTGGYAVHNLTLASQVMHSAEYYDGYSFIGRHGVPASLEASAAPGFPVDGSLGRGLPTGGVRAVLDGGAVAGYNYSAMYYDARHNVTQVRSTDHLGGVQTTCATYSHTGKPLAVRAVAETPGAGTTEAEYAYTYDGADRVASLTLTVAGGGTPASSTLTYEYDGLGRLSAVGRPLNTGASHTVGYEYDLHGWTTGITTNSFREELFYAGGPGTPSWNGNISAVRWSNSYRLGKCGYKLTYDADNRLTQATYGEGNAIASNTGRYSETTLYEGGTGNIRGIIRCGRRSPSSYGQMDNLCLTYDGYRLTSVSEAIADYDFAGSFEYKRAGGSQYVYDANGALVADRSRGIAYITYDTHGNPQEVFFTNGSETRYVYDSSGGKLRVEHRTAKPNITRTFGVRPEPLAQEQVLHADSTDYLLGGSLTVRNGRVDKLLFREGYAQATVVGSEACRFAFYYYNPDHLGNIREVVDSAGTVRQVTNYYPSGLPYTDATAVVNASFQPYKYNGKELDRMHGLNTYDYGARQYNPVLERWDRMDPLCEKYYSVSPYAYCINNSVRYIDPDGRKIVFVNGYLGFGSPEGGAIYWNGNNSSFVKGAQSSFKDYATPYFTNYDYNYLESASMLRESQGYLYAKQNYNALIENMEPGVDKFNFVSHSMGGAFSEGMIRYLSEKGWETENAVFLNAWEPAQITNKEENTRIDATCTNDPVQWLSKPPFGESDIPLSDETIRIKSDKSIWYRHRDLIDENSSNLWNLIKDLLKK